MSEETRSTAELLTCYDRPGPRYTSYPTAVEFNEQFTEADYRKRLATADELKDVPLSFYVHLPFCEERCLYCGCNVVATKHRDISEKYLDYLIKEIDLLARLLPNRRKLSQMHWGGGTPTYHSAAEMDRIFQAVTERFTFTDDAEIAVEVDPRHTNDEQLAWMRKVGFNRISMGVQDFSEKVQETVHRIQSYEMTRGLVEKARAAGFESVNIDLIYGLPHQQVEEFKKTLEKVIEIRPDRVAVYSFAYVPWIKGHQKYLPKEALPKAEQKIELFGAAIDSFTGTGYEQIGMDHFAVPEDELSLAIQKRQLHRNFMGYTVQTTSDMIAVGISSIGDVQNAFVQNFKKLSEYFKALDSDLFPVEKGYELDDDDVLRRYVITEIMCNFHLDIPEVEKKFGIKFNEYFAEQLQELSGKDSPVSHGLLKIEPESLDVTPRGRLFVRNVAMAFDRYLKSKQDSDKPIFSRTV
jgi:oxygen-independent coproporphyrinogen-3 oxidase